MKLSLSGIDRGILIGGVGIIAAASAVGWIASATVGFLFGFSLFCIWMVSASYSFVAAHFSLLILPGINEITEFLVIEGALLVILVGPSLHTRIADVTLMAMLAAYLGIVTILWWGLTWTSSIWITGLILILVVSVVIYIIDRYERIELGLLDMDTTSR